MSVTMICPNLKCGRTVVAADAARGKVVRCGHCQALFLVPRETRGPAEVRMPDSEPDDGKHRGRH
jgi:hypothetical protein